MFLLRIDFIIGFYRMCRITAGLYIEFGRIGIDTTPQLSGDVGSCHIEKICSRRLIGLFPSPAVILPGFIIGGPISDNLAPPVLVVEEPAIALERVSVVGRIICRLCDQIDIILPLREEIRQPEFLSRCEIKRQPVALYICAVSDAP